MLTRYEEFECDSEAHLVALPYDDTLLTDLPKTLSLIIVIIDPEAVDEDAMMPMQTLEEWRRRRGFSPTTTSQGCEVTDQADLMHMVKADKTNFLLGLDQVDPAEDTTTIPSRAGRDRDSGSC